MTVSISSVARCCRAVLLAAVALSSPAIAQVGASTDLIMGRVVGPPDSTPVAGARVTIVSVQTNTTKTVLTRADERFSVLFHDAGGQYRLVVTFLGLRPATLTLQRRPDEDRMVVTVYMSSNLQQLPSVEVLGRADVALEAAYRAGGTERTFAPQLLERL